MKSHASSMGGPSYEVACIAQAFANSVSKPSALDVGSGDGRNCAYLAELGFAVTAIERDSKLAEILIANASARELAIEVYNDDLLNFTTSKNFDLILLLGILHFLPRPLIKPLLHQYQSYTSVGGVHILTISHSEINDSTSDFLKMQGHLNSANRNTIHSSYSSWSRLAYEKYIKFDYHNNGIVDHHPIEKFVFQKGQLSRGEMKVSRIKLVDTSSGREIMDNFSPAMLATNRYDEICNQYGVPDFQAYSKPVEGQYSLLGKERHDQSIAFWGRTKCYFEGEVLVGLARYDSDAFYSDFSFN